MKETNTAMIMEVIDQILSQEKWTFYEPEFKPQIRDFLLGVYLANDIIVKVSTVDYKNDTCYIISHQRIAVLIGKDYSSWECDGDVCKYKDLEEDIWRLVSGLQYAALRVD